MIGAIIGDTVGSRFEFDNIRSKDFELFTEESRLTDDSIMTLAVFECLSKGYGRRKDNELIIDTLKKWGRAYPHSGYGGRFRRWLFSDDKKPYRSFGNGAAMRISAAGWCGRNEEEVKKYARKVTEVTHNHPDALKAAEVVAMCIHYAIIGKSKEFIKKYVEQYYSLDFDYEDLRRNFRFNETCEGTVPQAIYCFLISNDFEDCLRTTISIGGDCDTTAAISCAIAEAYYKYIPGRLYGEVVSRFPPAKDGCNAFKLLPRIFEIQKDRELGLGRKEKGFAVFVLKDGNPVQGYYCSKPHPIVEMALSKYVLRKMPIEDADAQEEALEPWNLKDFFDTYKLDHCDEETVKYARKIESVIEVITNSEDITQEQLDSLNDLLKEKSDYALKIVNSHSKRERKEK